MNKYALFVRILLMAIWKIVKEDLGIKMSSNKTLNVLYKLSISIDNTNLRSEIIIGLCSNLILLSV